MPEAVVLRYFVTRCVGLNPSGIETPRPTDKCPETAALQWFPGILVFGILL